MIAGSTRTGEKKGEGDFAFFPVWRKKRRNRKPEAAGGVSNDACRLSQKNRGKGRAISSCNAKKRGEEEGKWPPPFMSAEGIGVAEGLRAISRERRKKKESEACRLTHGRREKKDHSA